MSDKDLKKIQLMIKDALEDLLYEDVSPSVVGYQDTTLPMDVLDEIEAFIGEPIDFMGIS